MPEWFERVPAWSNLLQHARTCADPVCACRLLISNFKSWGEQLSLDSENTWLWFTFNSHNRLRWRCLACHGDAQDFDEGDYAQEFTLANLLRHHNSPKHGEHVHAKFGIVSEQPLNYTTPSKALFEELLSAFRLGEAPSHGYELKSGLLSNRKANQMLWVISQARDDDKRRALQEAESMILFRDERHGRMHCRFNCACTDETDLSDLTGFLGQSIRHQPDAIGITDATVQVFRDVCTSRAHAPEGMVATEVFHEGLFEHSREVLEALAVDSAENEIVSGTDMSSARPDGTPAWFPNTRHTLRDAAHSCRRVLSRLWTADPFLDFAWKFFMLMAKLIQWSIDLRHLYQECVEEANDAAVSTSFDHLRAAKHRIESWLTPMSRTMLNPSGSFGVRIFQNLNLGGKLQTCYTLTV